MSTETLAIYVHIPFCVRKCLYCDFNSGPAAPDLRRAYLAALNTEITAESRVGTEVSSVFFGGGTPSELTIEELRTLTGTLQRTFPFAESCEWTLEANPGTVTTQFLQQVGQVGFNRLSLGIQSFNNSHLLRLGRIHNSRQALQAFKDARQAGFENINLDLIFAIPGQTLEQWQSDLDRAIALLPEHLSLYNLTIEPGTEFARLKAEGKFQEVDEESSAAMYEYAMDATQAAGFKQYEISNYARMGKECRHNWAYWRNRPYLGFGVSAASYLEGRRWSNTGNMHSYIEGAMNGGVPRMREERLTGLAALAEEIMLGLRTREGIRMDLLGHKYQVDLASVFRQALDRLRSAGAVSCEGDRMLLTRRGKLLANEVCLQFL
ncbi:MAG: radical SAM family heme chaperone HemW [Acidobacteria bacterium]|nr:radical SAM family heme chaperone HemW [Acidobacteriota bacterium]